MTRRFIHFSRGLCAVMLTLLVCACSSDDSVVKQLISKIPSDTQMCAVVRLGQAADKAGLEKSDKGGFVIPDKFLADVNDTQRELLDNIAADGAGTDLEAIAFFEYKGTIYLTGHIDNVKTFRKDMAKILKTDENAFTTSGDIETLNNVAIADKRYWISSTPAINKSDIEKFADIKEKASLASTGAGERLATCSDIGMAVSADFLANQSGKPEMRMLMAYIFDDPHTSFIDIKFENGLIDMTFALLNSKGEEARMSLPMEKIEEAPLRRLSNTSSMVIAMSLPSRMMTKLIPLLSQAGNYMPASQGAPEILTSVDGTAAFGTGAQLPDGLSSPSAPNSIALTLKGKSAQQAAASLAAIIKATSAGAAVTSFSDDIFTANTGIQTTQSALTAHFNEIAGASFGVLLNFNSVENVPAGVFDYMAMRLDAGGKAQGTVKIHMTARNRNSLAAIFDAFSK